MYRYQPRPPTPNSKFGNSNCCLFLFWKSVFHVFYIVIVGTETFHVQTGQTTYVQQQPQPQPGNQGPLRALPPGPPNQPTTPPNTDLKVQQMQQQTSMTMVSLEFFSLFFVCLECLM